MPNIAETARMHHKCQSKQRSSNRLPKFIDAAARHQKIEYIFFNIKRDMHAVYSKIKRLKQKCICFDEYLEAADEVLIKNMNIYKIKNND